MFSENNYDHLPHANNCAGDLDENRTEPALPSALLVASGEARNPAVNQSALKGQALVSTSILSYVETKTTPIIKLILSLGKYPTVI